MNTELCELMRSIEKEGVLVPLLVRTNPYGDGYEVISGHRRKEAAIWVCVCGHILGGVGAIRLLFNFQQKIPAWQDFFHCPLCVIHNIAFLEHIESAL